jgi:hypothetical protein
VLVSYDSTFYHGLTVECLDDFVRTCAPPLEECGGNERLERRAGLERLTHRRIGDCLRIGPPARHRQDLSADRIHHDDVAAFRLQAVARV